MKLYLGLAGWLLLYIYLPLVLIGAIFIYFRVKDIAARLKILVCYLFIAYLIPLGDVTLYSWRMWKVCPKAGLHIYRRVKVDGFITSFRRTDSLKYGYRFVEHSHRKSNLVTRWEKTPTGIQELVDVEPLSEWEYIDPYPVYDPKLGVGVGHEYIQNRKSKEIIAERWTFKAPMGWLDRWIGSVIENQAGSCCGNCMYLDIWQVREILIPKHKAAM